jgi:NAD(P)-dependent dehydrogenase (short-subunit alcohol dehydrogenase family)
VQELAGKVAVVTGAASGIGLAMAEAFAAEDMAVVLADVEVPALEEAADKLAAGGAEVLAVPTDVRHAEAVAALADATVARFGAVHVLCNNAGVVAGGLAWEVSPERFRWVVEVNLLGVAHGIHAFVPRMIDQGEGHVVNTASAAGLITGPGMASYYATKHGVVALTEALANDLALNGHAGIGTSVLCPEFVRTRIHEAERNLPPEIAPPPADDQEAAAGRQLFGAMVVEGGIEPAVVAAAVVDAVRTDRFYVLPHDTTLDLARRRWAKIEANERPFLWE